MSMTNGTKNPLDEAMDRLLREIDRKYEERRQEIESEFEQRIAAIDRVYWWRTCIVLAFIVFCVGLQLLAAWWRMP